MFNEILDRLTSLLGVLAPVGKERRDLKDQALRSISTALTETYLYYRDRELGKPRNLDSEAMLAKYWSAAAIPIRYFDRDLAERCQHKSDYWIRPDSYSENEIRRLGIRLDEVKQAYRIMLRPLGFSTPFSITGRNREQVEERGKATKKATKKTAPKPKPKPKP